MKEKKAQEKTEDKSLCTCTEKIVEKEYNHKVRKKDVEIKFYFYLHLHLVVAEVVYAKQILIAFVQMLSMDPNLPVGKRHNLIELIVYFDEVFVGYVQRMRLFLQYGIFDLAVHDQF
jgi:hypothetical protein